MAASNEAHNNIPEWSLGDRLRKAREFAGLEQVELADRTGISRNSVGNYENNRTTPRRPALLSWALATGVDLDWLLTGEVNGNGGPPDQGFSGSRWNPSTARRASTLVAA